MEKLGDFFKEIRERLSNPFLFSFLISWLVYNWRIPIALVFYKFQDLPKDGYSSFIDLIDKNLKSNSWVLPLFGSLIYTFLFPFFKNLILIFNAWIKAWESNWSIKFSKTGKISIDRYIKLRDTYEKRTVLLDETLAKEAQYLQENADLKNKQLELAKENNASESKYQKWIDYNSYGVLNGEWQFTKVDRRNNPNTTEWTLLIKDGIVSEIFNSIRDKKVIGRIECYHFNLNNNELIFYLNTLHTKNSNFESHFYVLRAQQGNNQFSYLTGNEDNDGNIEAYFRKVD